MFSSLTRSLRAVVSTVADAACATASWIAARLRLVRRRHQTMANSNVIYGAVITTVAAWVIGTQNVTDVLLAALTVLFGIVTVVRDTGTSKSYSRNEDTGYYPY